jgi:hypothetical protein
MARFSSGYHHSMISYAKTKDSLVDQCLADLVKLQPPSFSSIRIPRFL